MTLTPISLSSFFPLSREIYKIDFTKERLFDSTDEKEEIAIELLPRFTFIRIKR